MRFLPGFALAVLTAVIVRADIPPLLDDAWTNYAADIDYWAYTETVRALDAEGRVTREISTRYDPSKPYAEQYTVLTHTGKQSVQELQKKARQRGINRGDRLERPGGVENDAQPRVVLMGAPALAGLEQATVIEENEQSITYLIPLRPEGRKASMIEKFETRVRVSKSLRAFERVDISLAKPTRVKLVAKINEISLSIHFATIDPAFGPAATIFKDHVKASALFKKREGGHETVRSDFKRVKPYRERFSVEIGPARTIDF